MTVGFDSSVFVWTDGGYKNIDSISKEDRVGSIDHGKFKLLDIDSIYKMSYTGPMIEIKQGINGTTALLAAPEQRMFWFDGGRTKIGTAKEFRQEIMSGKVLEIPIYDSLQSINLQVTKKNISYVEVVNRVVWGITNKSGNLIIKSEGSPLIFSDCG